MADLEFANYNPIDSGYFDVTPSKGLMNNDSSISPLRPDKGRFNTIAASGRDFIP